MGSELASGESRSGLNHRRWLSLESSCRAQASLMEGSCGRVQVDWNYTKFGCFIVVTELGSGWSQRQGKCPRGCGTWLTRKEEAGKREYR